MSGLDPMELPLGGMHLIEASAGTGKTYTIATLFLRLVLERELPIDHILVVTFTEAAAAELRDRIRTRLRDAVNAYGNPRGHDPVLTALVARRQAHAQRDVRRLQLALRSFDEAVIATIHGFCQRVLHDRAFETGSPFDAELLTDQLPLLDEVVRDFWARELYEGDKLFVAYLKRQNVTPMRLVQLARRSTMHPDLPILPAAVDIEERPDVAPFIAAYGRMRELWWRHREEIVDILRQHPGLYVKVYPEDQLPVWFQSMDLFLREDNPGSSLGFEKLEKFSSASLKQYTKKEYQSRIPQHAFFDACEALLQARRPLLENFDLRLVRFKRDLIDYIRKELPRRKRRHGQQSFDDLLNELDRALRRRKAGKELATAIRGRYQAALIDEFQDTDPVQYRIFRSIYGGTDSPLYLIGDPKQAIYGFRGADIFAYLEAAKSIRTRQRHTMDTNWRSDPGLLSAVERLFSVQRPFYLDDINFVPVRGRPEAIHHLWEGDRPVPAFELRVQPRQHVGTTQRSALRTEWGESEIPRIVAHDIATLLDRRIELRSPSGARRLRAGDIAVLVRKNAQAQQVQSALRKMGIPSVVYGDASVLETAECRDLKRVLSAIAEPTHSGLLRAAVTTELLGVTGTALYELQEDDAGWNYWIECFRRWHRRWVDRGFIQMFRSMLDEVQASDRLLALRDGERRMTNFLHLAELLHRAATTQHLGPAGLLRWLQEARDDTSLQADALKLRLESDDQAVQLITIHRSKGLEFPVVYCPYLWASDDLRPDEEEDLLFHDPEGKDQLTLDISLKPRDREARGKLPHIKQARFESSAESLRLLYVAVTRARHRCVLYWGLFDRAHHTAFGYLLFSPGSSSDWSWDPGLVSARIKKLDDDQMLDELRVRGGSDWCISVVESASPDVLPHRAQPRSASPLAAKSFSRRLDRWFRTSSFTEMTSAHRKRISAVGRDDHDYDEQVSVLDPVSTTDTPEKVALAEFPRGAKAGNFFHEVLEHIEFDASADRRRSLLSARLRTYGYDVNRWLDPVDEAVDAILRAPLQREGPALLDVPAAARHSELPFVMPVGPRDGDARLHRTGLARVFEEHPQGLPLDYASRLERLGFAPLRGFLKGYIDLVFRHEGRWYVVDYKSNHLGPSLDDYRRPALAEVMAADHYILQYHLYVVAVVRHLRHRIRGFTYARDFGGVFYLFLRGMTEQAEIGTGVYFDDPPEARIDALDRIIFAAGSP